MAMENIKIEATERTPEVNFDFSNNTFLLKGESYPEDIAAFYGTEIKQLEDHLSPLHGAEVNFTFELIYFNSSTAMVIMGLFETLDDTDENGNSVTINWRFEDGDDNMEKMGEVFGEELKRAKFVLEKTAI